MESSASQHVINYAQSRTPSVFVITQALQIPIHPMLFWSMGAILYYYHTGNLDRFSLHTVSEDGCNDI
jgi:hypothetical protein